MICRYVPALGERVLPDRHVVDGDHGGPGWHPPLAWTGCKGCQPCTEPHCLICTRAHATVCASCIGVTRNALLEVARLWRGLPVQALAIGKPDTTLPMVLMSPGCPDLDEWVELGMERVWRSNHTESGHPDDFDSDPEPILLTLRTWTSLYRQLVDKPTDLVPTGPRDMCFLLDNLHLIADVPTPTFKGFADDIAATVTRLETCLHDGDRDDPAGVACFSCGGTLVRRMTKDGLEDRWTCRRCTRQYTDPAYHLAVRAKIETATA